MNGYNGYGYPEFTTPSVGITAAPSTLVSNITIYDLNGRSVLTAQTGEISTSGRGRSIMLGYPIVITGYVPAREFINITYSEQGITKTGRVQFNPGGIGMFLNFSFNFAN